MGLYIKDMEMPRTCYDCKFRKRNGLELICPVFGKSYKIADTQVLFARGKDCPLVEVPEPHGRMIDADKLKSYWEPWEPDHSRYFDADHFIHTIDVAQTIIPASEEEE